jgi:hypothetical protein
MRKRLLLVLTLVVVAATAQTVERHKPKDKDRWGWMQLLRDDVNAAMARANLEKKQRNTLEKDLNTLRKALDAHQGRTKVDQPQVDKALKSIRHEFRNRAFTPAERDDILEDLDHLPIKEKAARQQRPRNPRNPMPRAPRRYPY